MEHWLLIIIGILLLIIFVLLNFSVVMKEDGSITFRNMAHNLNAVTVGRLFDRFYTVEISRNSTGLGLAIAKVLIERMGGTICAEYEAQQLFITITFPDGLSGK